ncbi:MAG: amidohydrolase family protein [Candidatus Thorarchaeota archaeon]
MLICHGLGAKKYADQKFPNRFIYAKYFSGSMRFTSGVEPLIKEIETLKAEGYHMAKMQSAPVMRGRASASIDYLRMDDDDMARFFDAMKDRGIPFLLHLSDPDTYYASRYTDSKYFSSKERDLNELEGVLQRHSTMKLQLAHFAAQPEIHRLDNLARWFDTYPNFNIDTSSARWLSRELSKDPKRAREFFIKYQDRILFGTDCVSWGPDRGYYEGRYLALRLLFETEGVNMPLPFTDSDTVNSGGTFINGLNLPDMVLQKIYWDNVHNFYSAFLNQ